MRHSINNFQILISDDKTPIGISLGYDFCAEHEWGIKGITKDLGILGVRAKSLGKKQRIGLASRVNTKFHPGNFSYGTKGDYTGLLFMPDYWEMSKEVRKIDWKNLPHDLTSYKFYCELREKRDEGPLVTAWSENSFGIIIKGVQGFVLKNLLESFKNNDALITFLGDENPFSNSSLTIISKQNLLDVDDGSVVSQMEKVDLAYINLDKVKKKLDLEGKMRKAGKYFSEDYDNIIAVSVKINDDDKPVVWINASQNSGWYTVKQVQDFIKDDTGKQLMEFKEKKI